MSTTEVLRRMLDERGVEWGANDTYRLLVTSWKDASGHSWAFMEHRDGSFSKLTAYHLTPEQAIAATLGRGKLSASQVSNDVYAHSIHADCADADWQAIADELNNTLGSYICTNGERTSDELGRGTCRVMTIGEFNGEGTEYYDVCSNCGYEFDDDPLNYCPNCGRGLVVDE